MAGGVGQGEDRRVADQGQCRTPCVDIPGASRAVIDPAKIRDYLLAPSHPVGRFKAAFFAALGFGQEQWTVLQGEFLIAVRSPDAEPGQQSPFGQKYEVRATIHGPAGSARVTSVWIVLHGEDFPRFVTAFPE